MKHHSVPHLATHDRQIYVNNDNYACAGFTSRLHKQFLTGVVDLSHGAFLLVQPITVIVAVLGELITRIAIDLFIFFPQ